MSYGFRIRKANGAIKIDSDSFGSLFAEALVVPANIGTFVKSYPNLAGMTLKGLGSVTKSISYPGGIPTVILDTTTAGGWGTFYLFVV